ncbi:MAG: hypothetical protein A2Y15_05105 [Clostridiales bacterium GWF2_36_10]|nr:MAG: hypothetical protein A2Y15_05105 [Clostridiales bacterium GWF2_36_10]HAN20233.1 hypothetical protein [Clostridiales bacterium]
MNNCPLALTTTIGAAAAAISKNLTAEEIAFLAAVLTQLGDTLTTIAARKALYDSNSDEPDVIT